MSDNDKPKPNIGSRDPAWWTPERRKAASDYRKAHPQGARTKEWWAAHPEAKAANALVLAKAREVWAATKAREDGTG